MENYDVINTEQTEEIVENVVKTTRTPGNRLATVGATIMVAGVVYIAGRAAIKGIKHIVDKRKSKKDEKVETEEPTVLEIEVIEDESDPE